MLNSAYVILLSIMAMISSSSSDSICLSEAVLEQIDKKTELVSVTYPDTILDVTDVVPLLKNLIQFLEFVDDDIEHLLSLESIKMPILETANTYFYKISSADIEIESAIPTCYSYSLKLFTPANGEDLIELLTFFASEKCGIPKVLTILKARGKTVLSQNNMYLTTLPSYDANNEKTLNTYPSFVKLDDSSEEKFSIESTTENMQNQKVPSIICVGSSKTLLTNLHKKYFQNLLTDFKLTGQKVIPILKKLSNSRTASAQDKISDSIYMSPPVSWINLADKLKRMSEKENWKKEITYDTVYETLKSLKTEFIQLENKLFQFQSGNPSLLAEQLGLSSKTVLDPKFTFKLKDSYCNSKHCFIVGDAFMRHSNENNVRTTYKIRPLNTMNRLIDDEFLIQSNEFEYTCDQLPTLSNCISDNICEFEKVETLSTISRDCAKTILGLSFTDHACKYIHDYETPVMYHVNNCHNKSAVLSFSSDYVGSIYCNNSRIKEQNFQKGTYLISSVCRIASQDGLTTLLDYDTRPGNINPPAIRLIEHSDNVSVHIIYISVLVVILVILITLIICSCRGRSNCGQMKCCFVTSQSYIDTHELECGAQDTLSCRSRSIANFHGTTSFHNLDMSNVGQQLPSAPQANEL